MLGFLVLAYTVGLIFGSLSLIEWMVSRIARIWLADPPKKMRRITR